MADDGTPTESTPIGQEPNRGSGRDRLGLVLVVEDMALIAMILEDTLTEAGYAVLGPASSVSGALSLISQTTPDVAVLDVNLGADRVTPVAHALAAKGVPFVVASALLPDALADEPVLAGAVRLAKPTDADALLKAIGTILQR